MSSRAALSAAAVLSLLVGLAAPAEAYDFEVRALTLGQGYQLRLFRPITGDILLNRRRFTQTLSLNIWNIGKERRYTLYDTKPDEGARYFFASYIRIQHDFGEYTGDRLTIGARRFDAADLIPELQADNLALDVLYAYAGGHGIGGILDIDVGRQLLVDTLDWWSFDGALARVHLPAHLSVEAFGGTRVRDSSPLGSAVQELDGTAGSECAEYVEGDVPGSGAWRPIDRAVPMGENPFTSEFDVCPQRDELMPTFGGAIELTGTPVEASLSYRRSVSRTPGLIGPEDRFEYPDTGLYPNETGAAPGWGVNEERLAASVRYTLRFARGRGWLMPLAAARYSLLHGLLDEALAGVRVRYGPHSLAPEYFYSFPTFDGDSIFNVFSTQPYHDARLTYELRPASSSLSGYVRGWVRSYAAEDRTSTGEAQGDLAGGGQLGGRYRYTPFTNLRLDLFHDDGFGGARTGGYLSGRWRVRDDLDLASRVSVIRFAEDRLEDFDGTTYGGQLGAVYLLDDGVALQVTIEENTNRYYDSQFRMFAVLDLAFHPEN